MVNRAVNPPLWRPNALSIFSSGLPRVSACDQQVNTLSVEQLWIIWAVNVDLIASQLSKISLRLPLNTTSSSM